MDDTRSRDELLAASLTAESAELLPCLPYLLQDLWELGGSPRLTVEMLRRNLPAVPHTVLSLARGDALFAEAGLRVAERAEADEGELADVNDHDMACIARGAAELAAKHPAQRALFEGYVQSQLAQVDDLENNLLSFAWLLQKTDG